MFDIHKVKPVHGWREFIGEVGIIVLGVLIALAFEQAVEIVHWHKKVRETMETVKDSVADQVFAATEQQMAMPCITQQLDRLEDRILAPGLFRPVRLSNDKSMSYVVRIPTRTWSDSVWNTVVTEGVSTHYDHDLRHILDNFYSAVGKGQDLARQADDLNSRLNALSRPIAKNDAMALHFTETIENLRSKEELLALISQQIINDARWANVVPPTRLLRNAVYQQSGTLAFCQKNGFATRSFKSLDFSPIAVSR